MLQCETNKTKSYNFVVLTNFGIRLQNNYKFEPDLYPLERNGIKYGSN